MGGVPTPQHMDGRSILPLLLSRNRAVRDNWPDSFLIESSGRRETAEQIAESRARLQIERQNMKLVNSSLLEDFLDGAEESTTTTTISSSITSTAATLMSSTVQNQEDAEEEVDTDNEEDDAMDSSAAALEDDDLEDAALEEGDEELVDQDNDLPLAPYITKMMRLNSECSDPALLKNCLPGQKWKCVNEEGRWRKHKCKFHVSDTQHC